MLSSPCWQQVYLSRLLVSKHWQWDKQFYSYICWYVREQEDWKASRDSVGKNLGVMRNQYCLYKQDQTIESSRTRYGGGGEWQCFILKLVTSSNFAKSSWWAFGVQVRASMYSTLWERQTWKETEKLRNVLCTLGSQTLGDIASVRGSGEKQLAQQQ